MDGKTNVWLTLRVSKIMKGSYNNNNNNNLFNVDNVRSGYPIS